MAKSIKLSEVAPETPPEPETPNPYADCKNKTQLGYMLVCDNPDAPTKDLIDLASKVRPDLECKDADIANGRTRWRKENGVSTGRTRTTTTRIPGTTSISEASVWESAFFFVEQCGSIESAIAMLARLQNLKDIL